MNPGRDGSAVFSEPDKKRQGNIFDIDAKL